ncbi:MAG TPA: Hpt domain-containing protein [Polyangiaceae bacterium]|nr:Hpt domain-containing protein [Polyangiaceae bacterium]
MRHSNAEEQGEQLSAGRERARPASGRRYHLTIAHRLALLIVGLELLLVILLAGYFGDRQIGAMSAHLRTKAETVALLLSAQVKTAVAFADRQTAREAFQGLAGDSELSGIALFDQWGELIERQGVLSELAMRAPAAAPQLRVFELPDRVLGIAPVQSREGPRGTLVVELTKARLRAARHATITTALLVSLLALGLGGALASLVARSFATRLQAIAHVASRVAAGDLSQQAVVDPYEDEIGSLARSVGSMLEQLKALIADIASRAEQEQARLESLVQQRTRELEGRNEDLRQVLDSVDQGLFTIDAAGRISKERSAILEQWLGVVPPSGTLSDYLERAAPGLRVDFDLAWEQLTAGFLPLELAVEQLPRRCSVGGRQLQLAYKPILDAGGVLERMLVVVSDVTVALQREHVEAEERDMLRLFSRLLEDRTAVAEFLVEAEEIVQRLDRGSEDAESLRRSLHTLKGNAALFGLDSLAKLCHELEDQALEAGGALAAADGHRLREHWRRISRKLANFTAPATDAEACIRISEQEHRQLVEALRWGMLGGEWCSRVEAWRLEPTELRLRRLSRQAEYLASRLGKLPIDVRVESNAVRMNPEGWLEVWSCLPHLIRNAVDHGLEGPEERQAEAKPAVAQLVLRTRLTAREFAIEIEDSGRGIDWAAIAEAARRRGLPCSTRAELSAALLSEGVSTRQQADESSGRGMGTAALAAAVRARGGTIEVMSESGRGTCFRLRWPVEQVRSAFAGVEPPRAQGAAQALS